MRKILFIVVCLSLGGCASMSQMNENMEAANVLMGENIQTMERSREAIQENTRQIERSTAAMRDFQYVFPIFFSILLLIFIFILFKLSCKMVGGVRTQIKKKEKKKTTNPSKKKRGKR